MSLSFTSLYRSYAAACPECAPHNDLENKCIYLLFSSKGTGRLVFLRPLNNPEKESKRANILSRLLEDKENHSMPHWDLGSWMFVTKLKHEYNDIATILKVTIKKNRCFPGTLTSNDKEITRHKMFTNITILFFCVCFSKWNFSIHISPPPKKNPSCTVKRLRHSIVKWLDYIGVVTWN